jgi:hypothetical protein
MAAYLLVAHQTAESPELTAAARDLAYEDEEAEFLLLVPATPVNNLLVWEEGETREVAERRARRARSRLEAEGLSISDARIGDGNPLMAIADQLREQPGGFAAIVISTLPVGVSRWLNLDLPSRVRRQFPNHRILHVAGLPTPTAAAL